MLNMRIMPITFSIRPNSAKVIGPSLNDVGSREQSIRNLKMYLTIANTSNLCLLLFIMYVLSKLNSCYPT